MDEIRYFGSSVAAGGLLANSLVELMSNEVIREGSLFCPYHYVYSIEDAKALSSDSFKWPVIFKPSLSNDELYQPGTLIKSHKELTKKIAELESKDANAAVLIAKPLKLKSGAHHCYSFYLARDYLLINSIINDTNFLVNYDNSAIFEANKLNKQLVYKVVQYASNTGKIRYLIDSIVKYDDLQPEQIKRFDYSILSADSEEGLKFREEFSRGYKLGRGSLKNIEIYSFPYDSSEKLYVTDFFSFGVKVGALNANLILRSLFTMGIRYPNGEQPYDLSFLSLFKSLYPTEYQKILAATHLHNAIISNEFDSETLKLIAELLTYKALKPIGLSNLLMMGTNLTGTLHLNKSAFVDQAVPLFIGQDSNDNVTLRLNLELNKNSQLRIYSKDPNLVIIRFQALELTVSLKAESEGKEPQVISCNELGNKFEADLRITQEHLEGSLGSQTLPELATKIESLNHICKSQAGSEIVYTPVKLVGDYLVSTLTNENIIPVTPLIQYLRERGIFKVDASMLNLTQTIMQ